jgi:hypothetical protein
LIPWGVNQRYDLLIDQGGTYLRCQCKTGRLRKGAVQFRTNSTRSNRRLVAQRGYVGEADVFLIHCPEVPGIYAVPVEEAPSAEMRLRVTPCKNNQASGIHWAVEYELPA